MNSKIKPAIIGGVIVGLLSAIPFINFLNICCCLWAILGGMVAAYLYIKASPTPVNAGEGAVLGVLSGVIGAAIYIVVGIPLAILVGATMMQVLSKLFASVDPRQAEMMRQQWSASQTVLGAILRGLFTALLLVVFSTLGGLVAVPIFEKRKGGPDLPPPPQGFGAGTPPTGYTPAA